MSHVIYRESLKQKQHIHAHPTHHYHEHEHHEQEQQEHIPIRRKSRPSIVEPPPTLPLKKSHSFGLFHFFTNLLPNYSPAPTDIRHRHYIDTSTTTTTTATNITNITNTTTTAPYDISNNCVFDYEIDIIPSAPPQIDI